MATKTKKKRPSTNNRIRDAVRNWTTLSSSERLEMAGEFLAEYPLTSGEREIFVQSPKRVDKILAVEKYRDARIVARIVASDACIASPCAFAC
jgi:hypothetical protein